MSGRPVVFGEVLFDRFPDGSAVLGGAPFNVAWNLQALGLQPLLISRIGNDPPGESILAAMVSWGMDVSGIQRDPQHPTGTVEVTLEDGEPRFDIATGRAWDHIAGTGLPALPAGGILYHGSLALRSEPSRSTLERLRDASGPAVLLDVNLRPPWWDRGGLDRMIRGARWAKLNRDELAVLEPGGAAMLLQRTGLESVIVTRGPDGAVVHHRDGGIRDGGRPEPAAVVDTVGAGDAFTSVVILGLTLGWPWADILDRAQAFASAVVGLRGAISRDPEFYAPFHHRREIR